MHRFWGTAALLAGAASNLLAAEWPLCLPDDPAFLACLTQPTNCAVLRLSSTGVPLASDRGSADQSTEKPRVFFVFDQSPGMAGFVRERRDGGGEDTSIGGRGIRIYSTAIQAAEKALVDLRNRVSLDQTEFRMLGHRLVDLQSVGRMTAPCGIAGDKRCTAYREGADFSTFFEKLWTAEDPLDLRGGDLVIFITDLQDQEAGIGAGALAGPLHRHVMERAVLIAPFKSRFVGPVYDLPGFKDKSPAQGSAFDGEQPFYLIAIGDPLKLTIFEDDLEKEIKSQLQSRGYSEETIERKVKPPMLFRAYSSASPESISLPAPWAHWTDVAAGDEGAVARWGGHQSASDTRAAGAIDLPRYQLLRAQLVRHRAAQGEAALAPLLSADLGTLPAAGPKGDFDICWGLGQSPMVCSGAQRPVESDSVALDITLRGAMTPIPTFWQFASSLILGEKRSCKPLRWQEYTQSPLTAVGTLKLSPSGDGVEEIHLTLKLSAALGSALVELPAGTDLIAGLTVPLRAEIRTKEPTWIADDREPWGLSRTAVYDRINAVNRGQIRSYGTGGLAELLASLSDAAVPNLSMPDGAVGHGVSISLPVRVFFEVQ